jgi:hypothetical protein
MKYVFNFDDERQHWCFPSVPFGGNFDDELNVNCSMVVDNETVIEWEKGTTTTKKLDQDIYNYCLVAIRKQKLAAV